MCCSTRSRARAQARRDAQLAVVTSIAQQVYSKYQDRKAIQPSGYSQPQIDAQALATPQHQNDNDNDNDKMWPSRARDLAGPEPPSYGTVLAQESISAGPVDLDEKRADGLYAPAPNPINVYAQAYGRAPSYRSSLGEHRGEKAFLGNREAEAAYARGLDSSHSQEINASQSRSRAEPVERGMVYRNGECNSCGGRKWHVKGCGRVQSGWFGRRNNGWSGGCCGARGRC